MIYPALFVGLGTTGLNILERLQELVSEEYKERPPIFTYVYLETDENRKPERRPGMRDEISVPTQFPVIQNLQTLRQEFDAGRRPLLEPWLNRRLLEFPGQGFRSGAGHIRMAGRLCLWENWAECTRLLTEARKAITADKNIAETAAFLRSFYERVNQPQPAGAQLVGTDPNVYVVGTLCGGTCGGMFVDIAYFLRELFGIRTNRRQAKLQGIFTVPDSLVARHPEHDQERKRCANAWASMIEFDYYNHPSTRYDVTWPDGKALSTSEPPFDWTYLVSCSGNETTLVKGGTSDLDALTEMVAMFLFTETVSDLLQRKNAIRVNFMGHPQYNVPDPSTGSMPAISTFGLSAFHYPKRRIAEAAACHQAAELCRAWIGTDLSSEDKLKAAAHGREEWDRILRKHLPLLTRRGGGAIEDDIRRSFEAKRTDAIDRPWSEILRELQKELERLEEGQECDEIIAGNVDRFETTLRHEIHDVVFARLNLTRNFADTGAFLGAVGAAVLDTINRLPTRYPRPEAGKIAAMPRVDAWVRFVLRKAPVERQKRALAFDHCLDYFLDVLRLVRGFRARPALDKIAKYLSTVAVGDEARVQELLWRDLSSLRTVLERSADALREREVDLARPLNATQNTSLVFKDQAGGLERDIQDVTARMRAEGRDGTVHRILTTSAAGNQIELTLSDFLIGGDEKVMERLVVEFRRDALDQVQQFRIPETVVRRLDADELRLFARRSLSHLELAGPLEPIEYPCFMVGGDTPGTPSLGRLAAGLTDRSATNRIDFGAPLLSQLLDHFLVFYTETGLLRYDRNLDSGDALRDRYDETASCDAYGLHVHKDGAAAFDKLVLKRDLELRGLFDVLTDVLYFQQDGQWRIASAVARDPAALAVANGHFKLSGDGLEIDWKSRDAIDQRALPNEYGRKKLAADEHGFALVKGAVVEILKAVGEEGYRDLLSGALDRVVAAEAGKGSTRDRQIEARDQREQALRQSLSRLLA
jgi:hypothetical protein